MSSAFNPHYFHAQLVKKLVELAESCYSFEQLKILSEIADLFYSNVDPQYQHLYERIEKSARHLRGLSEIGSNEVPPVHNENDPDNCPCPECLAKITRSSYA